MRELYITFSATQRFEEISYHLKRVIRKAVEATLDYEDFPYDTEVSVTLCDNEYIRGLNEEFRGIDKHTDVLSFPMYEDGEIDEAECQTGAVLGDIVISVERAREQARELGNTFYREIAFLVIHSTLHLLGYDHEKSKQDDEEQCRRQREIIDSLDI